MKNKISASKETLMKLNETMGNNFLLFMPMICNCVSSIENLEKFNTTQVNTETEGVMLKLWETLLRLQVFALITNLDLSTLLRANFRTELAPEKRCNIKYVNVITIEGYKYLFGYGKDRENGIWAKFKVLAGQINDDELKSDIYSFEIFVEEFKSKYALSDDRNSRNFSIHYDQEPLKVYENLEKIEGEDYGAKRTASFLGILDKLSVFINKYVQKYNVSILAQANNRDLSFYEIINIFPDKENRVYNSLYNAIMSFSKCLDNIVSKCRAPEFVKNNFGLDESFLEPLQTLIKSISPGIHIHFIYLDLASAIRAYFSSEYYFEKQMNLRRINIIVYEGFKHIYGYTDGDHERSFWHNCIYSILEDSTDQNLKDSLTRIEVELKKLATNTDVNNERLRECSVHYRYKDRDNVIPLFHALIESNPMMEMNKALMLLKILPTLIESNTNSMSVVYDNINEKIQLSNKGMIEKLDNILALIENSTATSEQKHNFTEMTSKIKGILLL